MKKGLLFYISSTLDYSISSVIKFTIYIIEMYTNVIKKLVPKIMFTNRNKRVHT